MASSGEVGMSFAQFLFISLKEISVIYTHM
jgi:hypothetical protein